MQKDTRKSSLDNICISDPKIFEKSASQLKILLARTVT